VTVLTLDTSHPLLRAKSFHCSECKAINLVAPEELEDDDPKSLGKHTLKCNLDTWIEFLKVRADLQMTTSQTMRLLIYIFKKVATKEDRFDAINTIGMDL